MPRVTVCITNQERRAMRRYAKACGISLHRVIKRAVFQTMEDELDLQIVMEHRQRRDRGEVKFYTLDEVKKELEAVCEL